MNTQEVKQAYANHIQSYNWDFYSTVTFRKKRHDKTNAYLAFSRVLEKMDATRAFVAIEPHKLDGIHVHALSRHAFRPELNPSSMWKYCFKAFGRSRVEDIDNAEKVTGYCSKYVVKGDFDYFYFGDKEAWLLDK